MTPHLRQRRHASRRMSTMIAAAATVALVIIIFLVTLATGITGAQVLIMAAIAVLFFISITAEPR